jgi:Na+/H+ antiporter NhaD/arsenite permease-like protein
MVDTPVAAAPDLTASAVAVAAVVTFVLAYVLVIAEEFTQLRKSKSVVVAAGVIWMLVAAAWQAAGIAGAAGLLRHNLLEYAELLLFLLAAMTYVNTLEERRVFAALRSWLVSRRFTLRAIYWITGVLAFLLSPVLDNLTTALVMGAVVLAMGQGNARFIAPGCVNVVVAANAGGAFSPFGDITTLMVWQHGSVTFFEFLHLCIPALVNWLVPALCMTPAIPMGRPQETGQYERMKPGAGVTMWLFAVTIALTVSLHQLLHLPPFLGMMTGLGALMLYGHTLRRRELRGWKFDERPLPDHAKQASKPFDIFVSIKRVEWDTLMFFYGVILCVGGLAALGYLAVLSSASYTALGPSVTNVLVGIASAIIDNIPVMFAVLSIDPEMSLGQWLLVTLTAGVGGSLLSIGSAAGVALMGQAHGAYTFFAHLKWSWAIALGFVGSIWVHFLLNARLF